MWKRIPWLGLLVCVHVGAQVAIHKANHSVDISIDGQPASSFIYGPEVTKPFLYPLRTAGGVNVLRSWPMESHAGDPHDHIHHRGVWMAHSDVNGTDFWNSDPSYKDPKMGHIQVTNIDRVKSGKEVGIVQAQLSWMNPEGQEIIHETRSMSFRRGSPRLTDFDIILTASVPVTFGDDKDGVFGLRVASGLEDPATKPAQESATGVMFGSNGCKMEPECWGKRGNWIAVSGMVENQPVTLTIFDHPQNPRFPTYWHARGYGLLAANIFGVKAFTKDSKASGAMSLKTGESLHFRFRIAVFSNKAQSAQVDELYRNWTAANHLDTLR